MVTRSLMKVLILQLHRHLTSSIIVQTVQRTYICDEINRLFQMIYEEGSKVTFTALEIMPRCSAAGLDFKIILTGFNAPLEFLTGFTYDAVGNRIALTNE